MKSEKKRTYMPLLFACLLADAFIRPFGMEREALPARWNILSGVIALLILWIAFEIYEKMVGKHFGRVTAAALFGALALSTALEIIQGQRFYSYVMDQPLVPGTFFILVLAAALYGADSGFAALDRVAGAILVLTGFSTLILFLSVLPQLRFFNLQTSPVSCAELWEKAVGQLYLPPELVMLPVLFQDKNKKRCGRLLCLLFAVSSGLCILGEMTLGTAYMGREQPVYTIARLGGISVFRRLDAVHIGVWLLLFILKIGLYITGLCKMGEIAFKIHGKKTSYCTVAATVAVILFLSIQKSEKALFGLQQLILGTAMLLALLAGGRKQNA